MNSSLLAQLAPSNFKDLVGLFLWMITSLLPIMAGLSLIAFIYGLILFILKSGDAKTHAEGRRFMIWGIVAIFVMVSLMAIIALFQHDLGFSRPLGIPLLPDGSQPQP